MAPPAHHDKQLLARTASACTVEGCGKPSWSAGLCEPHYRCHLRRHGGSPTQECWNGATGHNGHYDQRFVSLFLNELEHCGLPRFPDSRWYGALARADYGFRYSAPRAPVSPSPGPGTGHNALPKAVAGFSPQGLYGAFGAYSRAEGVLQSVNQACTRWLSARGA